MIQSRNPATGEVLRRFDPLTPEAIEGKLDVAAKAARTFPLESLEHRRFWMRRLALLLESDLEEIALLIVSEVGKTLPAARAEVDKCVGVCRYYAEHAERILEIEPIATEHAQSFVRWDPLGVVLAVMPWNFPLWQVFRFLAPALMAGNVALLKHAPNVPQCALEIEALVRRAGFPRGSLQTLLMEAEDVERVLGDERVAAVTVTGSEAAGRAVAAQAGYLLKKSLLELGGSDPFIVLPSADLPAAITNAVQARCLNNGQSCIAAKRFIVHTDVYDEFERGFVPALRGPSGQRHRPRSAGHRRGCRHVAASGARCRRRRRSSADWGKASARRGLLLRADRPRRGAAALPTLCRRDLWTGGAPVSRRVDR